jgi:hypothetical protein
VDGTLVNFSFVYTGAEGVSSRRDLSASTVDGIVRITPLLESSGILEVTASIGELVVVSNTLRIEVIPSGEDGSSNGEGIPTVTTEPIPDPDEDQGDDGPRDSTSLVDWLIALIVIIFISLFTYQIGAVSRNIRWAVRWGLTSFMGGLAANAYLSFGMPGSTGIILQYGIWGIVICVASGCVIGWASGLIWRSLSQRN